MPSRSSPLVLVLLGILMVLSRPGDLPGATASSPVTEVVVVFKTHFDIGYTDMATNVVSRYRTAMMDQALEVCRQSRDLPAEQQFKWTLPGWPLARILDSGPGQEPDRQRQVWEAFRQGSFVVHALPFTLHTELLELEDLVRGLDYSARLARSAGLPLPRDAKMTDVPCHTWIIPTLLRHAGVDFLHLGCNAASASPMVPVLFWWEGPDGSRLLTMYTAESYGTGLIPPAQWPHQTWLALIHTGDNHGPPTPAEVSELLGEAQKKLPGVKVRLGRLSDFAEAVLREKPALPVIRADMPDTWIHGPGCDPVGAKTARNLRLSLATTESLYLLLNCWGVATRPIQDPLARAYEGSLLYGEHTWGGGQYWVSSYEKNQTFQYGDAWRDWRDRGLFQKLESSWAEHSAYIEDARDLIEPILNLGMERLASAVAIEGQRVVVFNPLPWKRSGLVTITNAPVTLEGLRARDHPGIIPVSANAGRLQFLAEDIPPLGYRTYVPEPAKARSRDLWFESEGALMGNSHFRLALDPERACIQSWIDRQTGRELVDCSGREGFGQYLHERFDRDQVRDYVQAYVKITAAWASNELGKPNLPSSEAVAHQVLAPRHASLHFESSLGRLTAIMEAPVDQGLPYPVTTRITLYPRQPYVDLEISLQNKPADPWPEACWIALPFQINEPIFILGRLGSLVDPRRDIIAGANRHLYAVNTGLRITDPKGYGVGLCPLDHPLISLDQPGGWRFSHTFVPRRPAVYVNLYNNQWTTNFRFWNGGSWSSRIRLWLASGSDPERGLVTPALEARQPLLGAFAQGPAGPLPSSQRGLQLSRRGIAVTAFGPNPDGPGWRLRLWELAGDDRPCRVTVPSVGQPLRIQPCDLRGQPLQPPFPATRQSWTWKPTPFAPATFIVTPVSQSKPRGALD